MGNVVYPKALEAFLGADIDLLVDTIKVLPVSSTYVYNAAHDFLDDVGAGARIDAAATLAGKTVTGGVFDSSTNPTFNGISNVETLDALIVYQHTGVESTSHLIAFIDTRGDTTLIHVLGDGGPLQVVWAAAGIFGI